MIVNFLTTTIFALTISFKYVGCFHVYSGLLKSNQWISNNAISSRVIMFDSAYTVEAEENNRFNDTSIHVDDISNVIETNATQEVDQRTQMIKDYESELHTELASLENLLRTERLNLARVKDKVSESGKSGFFMVQAKVNDFLV